MGGVTCAAASEIAAAVAVRCARSPAAVVPAASPTPAKFALAEAACGPLLAPRADTLAEAALTPAAPHVAAQLGLYDPSGDGSAQLPAPSVALAPAAARRGASSRRGAATASPTGTVQRIRALAPVMADAARRHGIDPLLLHAIAHVESRHRATVCSHAGACGVMQVMPATARRFGMDNPRRELLQPVLNVDVSAVYLKALQRRFDNNLPLVLAAYNAGEGAVEKYGHRIPPYRETRAYVRDVLAVYAELRRRLAVAPAAGRGAV